MMHEREPSQEQYKVKTGEMQQGVMESGALSSDIFYDVLERSNEINKLCDMIYKESYNKRVMLLGEISRDGKPEENKKENEIPSWVNNIYLSQSRTINKLLEIKEVIESI